MRLVPLGDKVVVKQLEAVETTKSGIVLTGGAKEKPQEAEVIPKSQFYQRSGCVKNTHPLFHNAMSS